MEGIYFARAEPLNGSNCECGLAVSGTFSAKVGVAGKDQRFSPSGTSTSMALMLLEKERLNK